MKPAFNLSAWALKQQQLMAFLMLLIVAAGIVSYEKLSRNEDPAFTIKTAVVSAQIMCRVKRTLAARSFSSICVTTPRPHRWPASGTRCVKKCRM